MPAIRLRYRRLRTILIAVYALFAGAILGHLFSRPLPKEEIEVLLRAPMA